MQHDPGALNQEHFLVETARRLKNGAAERCAVFIHLSKLHPSRRQPCHLRIASETVKPLADRHQGQIFALGNFDLVLILRNAPRQAIDETLTKLRLLFSQDPLADGMPGGEPGQLATSYDLAHDYGGFVATAERAFKNAQKRVHEATGTSDPAQGPTPLSLKALPRLVDAIGGADISAMVRRQSVCVAVDANMPSPVFQEARVHIPEIGRQLMPGVDLEADPWLGHLVRRAANNRLFAWLMRFELSPEMDPISVDCSTDLLLSDVFSSFDTSIPAATKKRILFELSNLDAFADLGSMIFAREMLHARGYRTVLDGLTHNTLPYIDRHRLPFDFLKLRWGPDFENDLRQSDFDLLSETIEAAGTSRVILYECESARSLDCGRELGITLFQGPYIESLRRRAPKAASHSVAHPA